MSKLRNLPKVIWLQVFDEDDPDPPDIDFKDFNQSHEITWCVDQINACDIRYVLDKRQEKKMCGSPECERPADIRSSLCEHHRRNIGFEEAEK